MATGNGESLAVGHGSRIKVTPTTGTATKQPVNRLRAVFQTEEAKEVEEKDSKKEKKNG